MALYRKGVGEPILYIGGAALAHDANCCCSVCSNDVTVDCCLKGVSFLTGECDCDAAGGYVITPNNPCVCSSTTVSCCYEGNSLSLSQCDCDIIGGVSNPPTCVPPDPQTGGCFVCETIEIEYRTTPIYGGCLISSGNCSTIPNICAPPPGAPQSMCFEGCAKIGDCYTCPPFTQAYCGYQGSFYYYKRSTSQQLGACAFNGVVQSAVAGPGDLFCDNRCCDNQIPIPKIKTTITTTSKKCSSFMQYQSSYAEIYKTTGIGCGQDQNVVNISSNPGYLYYCNPCT